MEDIKLLGFGRGVRFRLALVPGNVDWNSPSSSVAGRDRNGSR
jgi:hypothetical protein